MKKFITLFMVVIFVCGASFSAASHAIIMDHGVTKDKKAEALMHEDCHTQAQTKADPDQIDQSVQNDKDQNKVCHKGLCKCLGSSCHSPGSIFSDSGYGLSFVSASRLVFAFDHTLVNSAVSSRLKRPPRA